MPGKVLDAYSLLAYLEGGPEAKELAHLIKQARDSGRNLLISAVDLGAVLSLILKELGTQMAAEIERTLETLPITVVSADQPTARHAAAYKASKNLPYAACFAAALAKVRHAQLVTGDEAFRRLNSDLKIRWLARERRQARLAEPTR